MVEATRGAMATRPTTLATALVGTALRAACGGEPQGPPAPKVQVAPVASAAFQQTLNTVSTLEATEEVELASQAGGRIQQILVASGEPVRKGELLIVLDQTQLRAEVASLRAQMERDQLNYRRFEQLVKQGAASALQRDEYKASYIASREALRGRLADLAYKDVRAPIDGVMGDLSLKPGDVLQAGVSVGRIIRNSQLQARIDVPAHLARQLRLGQPVQLLDRRGERVLAQGRIGALDPGVATGSQTLLAKATIANDDGSLRNGQRLRTRVVLGEDEQLAVPFTAVTRNSGQAFVYVVGSLAQLRRDPGKAPLEQLSRRPANTAVVLQRPVRLGELQGDRYPVLSGLTAGDQLITSSSLGLRQGLPVRISRGAEPPAERPAPAAPGAS
ncbi:MAG: efflux RND transporter periplasmic adaptor subunit [Cyanobium sp.]